MRGNEERRSFNQFFFSHLLSFRAPAVISLIVFHLFARIRQISDALPSKH